ncbi:MAG: extracellular solute-binding protein [bacterium]|nr:extracellular solute-binding protein [bacterium]
MTIRGRVVITLMALALVVAACGEDEPAPTTAAATTAAPTTAAATTAAPTTTEAMVEAMGACEGATLSFIGLDGEAGEVELEAWRGEHGVALETNWPGSWPQFVAAIKVGDVYDLATIAYHVGPRHIEAGLFQPIDTSRLENWDKMFPGLRENSSLRGADGQVYGVPIAWGDGPFIYHPGRVPNPPTSITELMEPEWEGRFTIFDSPTLIFSMLAVANGFDDGVGDRTNITGDQLEVVKDQALQIVRNASAFANGYRDATDVMVAGDSDLNVNGWEAMLTWAEEQGETLDFAFFEESGGGGWWDGLAIPVTADDVDCAYEYIDLMISDEINAQVGENLVSGVVNANSAEIAGPGAQIYDYDLVRTDTSSVSFRNAQPPEDEEAPEGISTISDWLDAWEEIKAEA